MEHDSLAEIPPGWCAIWKVQDGEEIRGLRGLSRIGRDFYGVWRIRAIILVVTKIILSSERVIPIAN